MKDKASNKLLNNSIVYKMTGKNRPEKNRRKAARTGKNEFAKYRL